MQGHELNYVEGYLEAAMALADTVLEKQLYEKRDTLVLLILYNARHAVELTQKFVIGALHAAGALAEGKPHDHDIEAHWRRLKDAAIGDEQLRSLILQCEPYIMSLARIDDDGQALRYPVRQGGEKSMADKALANIVVIRASLAALDKILSSLKNRTIDYVDERKTGTFAKECPRADIFAIAPVLPQKVDWTKPEFDTAKDAVRKHFDLSSRRFSAAVNIIKACRETKAIIGEETPLAHLEDQDVEQWRKRHPADRPRSELGTDYFDPARWAVMQDDARIMAEISTTLLKALNQPNCFHACAFMEDRGSGALLWSVARWGRRNQD